MAMQDPPVRPVRFLLSAELAERMEDAVARRLGGFGDRHSLAAAALDNYLLELEYVNGTVPDASSLKRPAWGPGDQLGADDLPLVIFAHRGAVVEDQVSLVSDEPLLGLHNRDWPSLWALGVLAEMASSGPVPVRAFMLEATSRAWKIAETLSAISSDSERKVTALLPTNRDKQQSSESAFQTFAIASVSRRPTDAGMYNVAGPLPQWGAIGLLQEREVIVGLTELGWELLERVAGLTPVAPHPPDDAIRFLEYLEAHVPSDWWGFDTMLSAVVNRPTREQYLSCFVTARAWKETIAVSAAQGYLARAREWGLVEPKMENGRYVATDLGRRIAGA